MFDLHHVTRLSASRSRAITPENPTGAKGGGAQSLPTDPGAHPAARELGKGWKVRPCLRDLPANASVLLADIEGPGIIRHIWCTLDPSVVHQVWLRITYDDHPAPAVECPLGEFFANGIDGLALVNSLPICVHPRCGMNSYWPIPFRRRVRMEIHNAGEVIPEFFFQVDYSLEPVSDETAYLNVFRSRQRSDPENPQLWILPKVRGCGQYVGTYLAWSQSHPGWWGEGEVKFFIDSDPDDAPTICGTGLEDYVGGAYCFAMELPRNQHPTTYSSMFLGHPQSIADPPGSPRIARHALYRWHVPDPVRFDSDLRVSVQALGWNSRGTYQPLADELTSVVYWYQVAPASG